MVQDWRHRSLGAMKPTCKLCETRHWTYEEHGPGPEKVRELGESVLRNTVGGRESSAVEKGMGTASVAVALVPKTDTSAAEPSRSPCNACNKPFNNRGKVCNACRQRAYRGRK
ncbi:hypothetical protein LCGC14_2569550 [marine sediment metagenome]|uniref:Uncharacterized protein n=1 Tax=marine sediment metagenome TaxID=412755 RepID=A0A0F9B5I1_9ZZZZ